MIDWYAFAANALWLIGLAWLVALLSWRLGTGAGWSNPDDRSAGLAFAVFCLGLSLSTAALWERIIWGSLTLISLAAAAGWLRRLEGLLRGKNQ